MLIASKYEEMYAPEVADFVYITDSTYSNIEIKAMEREILKTLDYSFGNPLCLHFLRRNSRAGDVSYTHTHTSYFNHYLMSFTTCKQDIIVRVLRVLKLHASIITLVILSHSKITLKLS